LGIEYLINCFAAFDDVKYEYPDIWNQFWFKLGAGLDHQINETLYFRVEAMYGIRTAAIGEKLSAKSNKKLLESYYGTYNPPSITEDTLLGHGFTVRVAIDHNF